MASGDADGLCRGGAGAARCRRGEGQSGDRTGAVRTRLQSAGRRALLPDRNARAAGAVLRRRAARRRRDAARDRRRPVPDDRDAARLGAATRPRSRRRRRAATATRRSTTTTSTTPSTATRCSTTPRAAGATPAARSNRVQPPAAPKAGSASPTSAMRRATRSTCSACWPTRSIVKPRAIGVTGISYGGGQSIELAYLKNRIRLPDGEFAPWTSPKGKAMEIRAAFPRWPWSDLVDALEPERPFPRHRSRAARTELRTDRRGDPELRRPACSRRGAAEGYVAPTGRDSEADLTKWYALTNVGEPFTSGRRSDRAPDLRLPPGLRHPAGRRQDRRRCCSRAAGPTTCSRPSSRCASTTPARADHTATSR